MMPSIPKESSSSSKISEEAGSSGNNGDVLDESYKMVIADLSRRGLANGNDKFLQLARVVKEVNPSPKGKEDPFVKLDISETSEFPLLEKIFSYLGGKEEYQSLYPLLVQQQQKRPRRPLTSDDDDDLGTEQQQLLSSQRGFKLWSSWTGTLDCQLSLVSTTWEYVWKKFLKPNVKIEIWSDFLSSYPDTNLIVDLDLRKFTHYPPKPEDYKHNCAIAGRLKGLHDLIAKKCPNIKELKISLLLPKTKSYSKYISTALFSLDSVIKLTLCVDFFEKGVTPPPYIDVQLFNNIIRNLRHLRSLTIGGTRRSTFEVGKKKIRFYIDSLTLESLLLHDMGPLVSVTCPALTHISFNAGKSHNNVMLPILYGEYLTAVLNLTAIQCAWGIRVRGRHVYRDQELPPNVLPWKAYSDHFNVPDNCEVSVARDITEWGENHYLEFIGVVKANATCGVVSAAADDLIVGSSSSSSTYHNGSADPNSFFGSLAARRHSI